MSDSLLLTGVLFLCLSFGLAGCTGEKDALAAEDELSGEQLTSIPNRNGSTAKPGGSRSFRTWLTGWG